MNRRELLTAGAILVLPSSIMAMPAATLQAVNRFTGGRNYQAGKVAIVIASLIENGNTVPITIRVDSPMTASSHVRRIGIFTQANPQPDVAIFTLTPASGRAVVATRIRLAASQPVLAIAEMSDGTLWQQSVDVIVTLAACIEGAT
jgi:sulfur-oxidizing protein SoxY